MVELLRSFGEGEKNPCQTAPLPNLLANPVEIWFGTGFKTSSVQRTKGMNTGKCLLKWLGKPLALKVSHVCPAQDSCRLCSSPAAPLGASCSFVFCFACVKVLTRLQILTAEIFSAAISILHAVWKLECTGFKQCNQPSTSGFNKPWDEHTTPVLVPRTRVLLCPYIIRLCCWCEWSFQVFCNIGLFVLTTLLLIVSFVRSYTDTWIMCLWSLFFSFFLFPWSAFLGKGPEFPGRAKEGPWKFLWVFEAVLK